MKTNYERILCVLKCSASVAVMSTAFAVYAPAALAQDQDQDQDETLEEEIDTVIVTGSRIRRDEFSSATPIQVLDMDAADRIGIASVTDLLAQQTVVAGQQLDLTINTNAGQSNATETPPDGGTGSTNIDLRGIGPERTLILLNGRRLGAAGVRGAPSQPDINMIPIAMVERVELITGSASSIYGADAVAGVVNVILKDDFEGLEVKSFVNLPEAGGGETQQYSVVAGARSDRASFVLGAEFFSRTRVTTGDRKASRCLGDLRVDANDKTIIDTCRSGFFDNIVLAFPPSSNDIFFAFTPGRTGVDGFANFTGNSELPQSPDPQFGRGGTYSVFDEFNDQDERRQADLVVPLERFSIMGNTTYDLQLFDGGEEFYTEFFYTNRRNKAIGSIEQIFPAVLGRIPFEENFQRIDVGSGLPLFVTRDADGEIDGQTTTPNGDPLMDIRLARDINGELMTVDNPQSPFPGLSAPIITIDAINQIRRTEVQQFRFVSGVRGDFPTGWLGDRGWSYDIFQTYDRGIGFQSQPIVFEPRLIESQSTLRMDIDGNLVCGNTVVQFAGFETVTPCVVVDFFAPSLYESGPDGDGRFATEEEEDFLIGNRTNRTVTNMYVVGGYVTGDLFDIKGGGTTGVAIGAEWRKDSIRSFNSFAGEKNENAAENSQTEGETIGSRWIYDIFAEVSIPLLVDHEYARLLQVEGAVRYTEEQNFGSEITYRGQALWRPTDELTLSASFGTSFRAPNAREQFLGGATSTISSGSDPCSVPQVALVNGVYDRSADPRSDLTLNNCVLSGADPTQLGAFASIAIPVRTGGNPAIKAETSESFTATVLYSVPWFERVDIDIAVSYWDLDLKNTVEEPPAATILANCFTTQPNLTNGFCSRVGPRAQTNVFLDHPLFIDSSFINIGKKTATGIDINTRLRFTIDDFAGEPLDLGWTTVTTYMIDQVDQVLPTDPIDDNVGEIGTPVWRVTSTFTADWDRFSFTWQARYIDNTSVDPQNQSAFTTSTLFSTTTPTRTKRFTRDRLYHTLSVSYSLDSVRFNMGVNNLFDTDPPRIGGGGPNRNKAVTSSGFDLFGRTVFFNATASF